MKAGKADLALLDERERQIHKARGDRYLLVRALLKRELSRRTGIPAEKIRFSYTPNGKPVMPGIHFNLSHSGNQLCLAFHDKPIGVDIQQIRPHAPVTKLAPRIMCPEQLELFLNRGAGTQEFFYCWCIAESLVKQAASTIWQAPRYPFLYHNGAPSPLFSPAPQIELFSPAPGYCGAIAYELQTCQRKKESLQ